MINVKSIRDAHRACGCLSVDRLDATDHNSHTFRHQGCQLNIRGLRMAVDCDLCNAFGPDEKKPDLFVLRETDGSCEWIVVEIQRTIDRAAIPQVSAGLQKLAEDPLFAVCRNCKPRVLLAHKRRVRTQDLQSLRSPLLSRGKPVRVDTKRCGTTL